MTEKPKNRQKKHFEQDFETKNKHESVKGFGCLREQAKTLSDLFWENEIDFQIWLNSKGSVTEPVELAPKFAEKWVPLSDVEEKACLLRKLLENQPPTNFEVLCYDCKSDKGCPPCYKYQEWFERFEREFEAAFGKEGSGEASKP